MKSDLAIAREVIPAPISEIAAVAGFSADEIEPYGKYKAKISEAAYTRLADRPDGKLILVTAVNPTPAGEGKTTTAIGLADALAASGRKTMLALREPSLGPVFGVKGGAAGGGYAQVIPMEDINLHFTGDIHAVTAANNLLCALIDNHIHQGNELNIDKDRVVFSRVLDMNDRALRSVTVGQGGEKNGVPRADGFMISVASEVMAVLCLAADLADLKQRLGRIIVAYTRTGEPVTAKMLHADGAMTVLLKDAIQPNLVQTLEKTPCLMHGGPFANIAHGCNSVRATRLALKAADYVVTEAGFGADLGAEKFMDIKCRLAQLKPDAVVLVVSVRALKYNGGVARDALKAPDTAALLRGLPNLTAHIENMQRYGVPVVVAVNRFDTDSAEELAALTDACDRLGVACAMSEVFAHGSRGGAALAEALCDTLAHRPSQYHPLYEDGCTLRQKIETLATQLYGAADVAYTEEAARALDEAERMGFGRMPVCVAKTQYSLSDDPKLLGRPAGFTLHVRGVRICAGAGFVVVLTGDIMTMPGLPKVPAAYSIDLDEQGQIVGLF